MHSKWALFLLSPSLHILLGIRELKWMAMGEFNTDDHYIYHYGRESLRRNGVAFIVNNRVQNAVLRCSLKNENNLNLFLREPLSITVIQVHDPTNNVKEAKVKQFCEDPQDLRELTQTKEALVIIGDWDAKVGSQGIPGITGKFGLGEQYRAGQRPTEFCLENTLVTANTLCQQHKRHLYT